GDDGLGEDAVVRDTAQLRRALEGGHVRDHRAAGHGRRAAPTPQPRPNRRERRRRYAMSTDVRVKNGSIAHLLLPSAAIGLGAVVAVTGVMSDPRRTWPNPLIDA